MSAWLMSIPVLLSLCAKRTGLFLSICGSLLQLFASLSLSLIMYLPVGMAMLLSFSLLFAGTHSTAMKCPPRFSNRRLQQEFTLTSHGGRPLLHCS